MPSCYAVGAEKALIQAALRACFSRGKGFIPKPSKSLFYCVTNPQQRSDEAIWIKTKTILSMILTIISVVIFIASLQPYVAFFTFVLLIIKGALLLKRP